MSISKGSNNLQLNLPPRQSQALVLKLQGHTHAEIAQALKVSKQAVDRWSIQPAFREAYDSLAADLEERSLATVAEIRSETERLALATLQSLAASLEQAEKLSERLQLSGEILKWYQTLHPEPRNGIAVSASASAGEASGQVLVYLPDNERRDYPALDLVADLGSGDEGDGLE